MPGALVRLVAVLSAASLLAAWAWRARDEREAQRAWDELATAGGRNPIPFGPEMVANLPNPARRYFTFAIAPGTPLRMVAEIDMTGEIG